MIIDKTELINALKKISPGVSNKDIFKEYSCVSLNEKSISSFSERIIVSYPFELEKGFDCLVDYNLLIAMLEKINSSEIELIKNENEVILKTEKIESGIAIIAGEHPPITLPKKWNDFPKSFMTALEFCSFSVSKDMTIPSATCIHVYGDKLLSTDGKRLTQYSIEDKVPFDFHVPYVAIKSLKGYNFVKIGKGNNLIHFVEDNGAIFSFYQLSLDREITPENAKGFLDVNGAEIEFPKDFKRVIERASVMTEGLVEFDYVVDVKLSKNEYEVSSRRESGWFKEKGDIEYNDKEVTFRIAAPFLLEILSRTNKCTIGDTTCLFSGDNFKHVMVLV